MARSRSSLLMQYMMTKQPPRNRVAAVLLTLLIVGTVITPALALGAPVIIESRVTGGAKSPGFLFDGLATSSAKSAAAPLAGWNGASLTGTGIYYASQASGAKWGEWSFTPAADKGGCYNLYVTWPNNTFTGGGMLLPTLTIQNADVDVVVALDQSVGGNAWNLVATNLKYAPSVAKVVHLKTNPDSISNKRTYWDSVAFEPGTPTAPTPSYPLDGAIDHPVAGIGNDLGWIAGDNNYNFDLYLSSIQDDVINSDPGALAASDIATTSYDPDSLSLESGTTYYWKIVAQNLGVSAEGPVWNFTAGGFTVAANPANWTSQNTVTITFDATAAMGSLDHYDVCIDGGAYSTQTSPYLMDVAGVADGIHTVSVKAVDTDDNEMVSSVPIYLDKTDPADFSPTANPSSYTNAGSVTVTFATTDASSGMDHYEVAVDGGAYSTRTSPCSLNVSGLSDGTHTVQVQAFDVAGNSTVKNVTINLDKTAPVAFTPTIDPVSWTSSNSATIAFSTTDATSGVAVYLVSVDGEPPTPQTSPYTLNTIGLSNGVHSVQVYAVDAATNMAVGSVSSYIDRAAPVFNQCESPAAANATPIAVDYAITDPQSGVKKIDLWYKKGSGGVWTDSGMTSALAIDTFLFAGTTDEDTYYFGLVAEDNVGNIISTNSNDGSCQTIFDQTGPNFTLIDTAPEYAKVGDAVTITFTASEALADNPDVDVNGSAAAFSSVDELDYTYTYTVQAGDAEGWADIHVEGADLAGNTNFVDDLTQLLIDKTVPEDFTPTADPASWTNGSTVSIGFSTTDSVSDIDHYEIALDAGAYSTQTSPYALDISTVADGTHTVHVKAIDLAGNELIKDVLIYIDKSGPEDFTPTANPASWTDANSVSISFSTTDAGAGIDHYEVALDGGAYSTKTSPYALDVTSVADGTHTVHVKAIDGLGNELIKDVSIFLDKTSPADFTPTANPAGWTNANSVSISFSTTDAASGIARYEVALDGGAYATQTSPYALNVTSVADGVHTVHVKAIDNVGHERIKNVTISVDKAAPISFTPTADPSGWTNENTVSIGFITTDGDSGIDHYEVALDAGAYSTQTSPYAMNVSGVEGTRTVHVKAIDIAGNELIKDVAIYIDRNGPEDFTPTANPASWTGANSVSISFTTTDAGAGIDHYEVALDGGAYSTQASPYALNVTSVADGTHTVHVKAIDGLGNELVKDVSIFLDETIPADFTPTANPAGWTNANSVSISFSTTDAASGIARYEVALDGGAYATQTSPYALNVTSVADGIHTVHVKAIDNVGHERIKNVTISLDKAAPISFTPTADPSGWTKANTVTLTFATTDATSGIAHFKVALDDGAYSTQTSPYTMNVSTVADGTHTVHVKAIDNTGNEITRDVSIQLDKTGPLAFTPTSDPATWYSWPGASDVQITWATGDATSGIDHYEVALGAGAYSARTSPYSFSPTGFANGTYTLHVKAIDMAGNETICNVIAEATDDVTPPTASLTFTDPNLALGRQFDYVFWKNWMGVTTSAQNTYNINWSASDSQTGLANVYIDCRADSSSQWSLLAASTEETGTVAFDVSGRAESDSYQFRIRAIDTNGNQTATLYDQFGLYDATKLAPKTKIISPADGSRYRMGTTIKIKVQETMPVFKDPRVAGKSYKDGDRNWWFAGHSLTATPQLRSYIRKSDGRPTRLDKVLITSIPRAVPQSVANTNQTQVGQYLNYVIVNTWEINYTLKKPTIKTADVFQVELKYSDVVSVGNVRQADKPNVPGQILPSVKQEPLVNTLKQYEFARFWVN